MIGATLNTLKQLILGEPEGFHVGKPTAALVEPGKCQFGEDPLPCRLEKRTQVSHDTYVFRFELPDRQKPLNLSTCACILAQLDDVVRPYTPVSTNALVGKFDLMIKIYPNGQMTQKLIKVPVGGEVRFKHVPKNVKIQYPFKTKCVGMIVGGTGINPMIQALHAILGTPGDTTVVKLLYGSRTSNDILGKQFLDKWMQMYKDRLHVEYVLSEEPKHSSWKGERGFITKEMVEKHFPGPSEDIKIFICGPPPMYDIFCGPRDEPEINGVLKEMGYSKDQVYKF